MASLIGREQFCVLQYTTGYAPQYNSDNESKNKFIIIKIVMVLSLHASFAILTNDRNQG